MAATLLDANVLIALSVQDHRHHCAAHTWLGRDQRFATCPSTQGSLVRYLVRVASTEHGLAALAALAANARHEFWPDVLQYAPGVLDGVVGHRQVTDAYLAAVAESNGARLATFDRGLSLLRPKVVELIEE